MPSVMISARVDRDLKRIATKILKEEYGLTLSAALRMLLLRTIRCGRLPFEIMPGVDDPLYRPAKKTEKPKRERRRRTS